MVADAPETGTVGGINRATSGNEFWRNKSLTPEEVITSANILKNMDRLARDKKTEEPPLSYNEHD